MIKAQTTMAKAKLNTGQTLYAVNDLFFGPKSHISARYIINIGKTDAVVFLVVIYR